MPRRIWFPVVCHSLYEYLWGAINYYWRYRSNYTSRKWYRVREVFPITLILTRSEVLDGVSASVLAITSAGIANVPSSKGVKGSGQTVSFFPWLPGSQYCCDAKTLLTIELLGNVKFGNCRNPEEAGNWPGLVGHPGNYHCDCIGWWCGHRRRGGGITETYIKIHHSPPFSKKGLTCSAIIRS